MARKPLTPMPELLREKRLLVLGNYEDAQSQRRIEDIRRQCDIAVSSMNGVSAAAQGAHESQVRVTESADSIVMKTPSGPPPSFVGAFAGHSFLKRAPGAAPRKKGR